MGSKSPPFRLHGLCQRRAAGHCGAHRRLRQRQQQLAGPRVLSASGESCITATADCATATSRASPTSASPRARPHQSSARTRIGHSPGGRGCARGRLPRPEDGGSLRTAASRSALSARVVRYQASDCGAGLTCIPRVHLRGRWRTCDRGLLRTEAHRKETCSGECNTGADCCELPLNTTVAATAGQDLSGHPQPGAERKHDASARPLRRPTPRCGHRVLPLRDVLRELRHQQRVELHSEQPVRLQPPLPEQRRGAQADVRW